MLVLITVSGHGGVHLVPGASPAEVELAARPEHVHGE